MNQKTVWGNCSKKQNQTKYFLELATYTFPALRDRLCDPALAFLARMEPGQRQLQEVISKKLGLSVVAGGRCDRRRHCSRVCCSARLGIYAPLAIVVEISEGEEIFVGGERPDAGSIGVRPLRGFRLQDVGTGHAQMRHRSGPTVPDNTAVVENLLKLGGGFFPLPSREICLSANVCVIEAGVAERHATQFDG